MKSLLQKPRVLFALFTLLVVVWFGHLWLRKGPDGGEIFLGMAKAADFERGCLSVHGPVWWTPNFLHGQSWTGFWSTPLSLAALEAGRIVLRPFHIHALAAYRIVALLALAGAGMAMFCFALDLTGSAWTAGAAGGFYLFCPELTTRLASSEHFAFGGAALCFAFPPLICRALLRARREAPGAVLALAFSLGAFFLAATKMAVLSLPLAAFFALWLHNDIAESSDRFRFDCRVIQGGLLAFLLGCVPLFPLLREEKWMTLFSTDPLAFWQGGFALKSGISFFDRNGAILVNTPVGLHQSGSTFYFGLVWGAALLGAFLEIGPWREWLATPAGRLCRLFTGLTLFFTWISYGLFSAWVAHGQILLFSSQLPDWSLPLLWLGLAVQAAAVFRIASFWTRHLFIQILAALTYLFVPGFVLLSHLHPFEQVRAPTAFWTINGSFCVAVAGALALSAVVDAARLRPWARGAALVVVLAAVAADFAPYHAAFRKGALPAGTYDHFLAAAAFLRTEGKPGYVEPISGRYFYLQLPQLGGHPLTYEAATSYFQSRWVRPVQDLARSNIDAHANFLSDAGVRYIFIDKNDPDAPHNLIDYLRTLYPAIYENPDFLILENSQLLMPGLTTGRVVPFPSGNVPTEQILGATKQDVWIIARGVDSNTPEVVSPTRDPGTSLLLLLDQPRLADYHTISFAATAPNRPWVIVPEAYHPDWRAESDGKPVPVYRALGFLLAAKAARDGAGVTFHFHPPWWYNGCLALAGTAWLLCGWAWVRRRRF